MWWRAIRTSRTISERNQRIRYEEERVMMSSMTEELCCRITFEIAHTWMDEDSLIEFYNANEMHYEKGVIPDYVGDISG